MALPSTTKTIEGMVGDDFNFSDAILKNVPAEKVAYICLDPEDLEIREKISYGMLCANVERFADGISGLVEHGDRVAIALSDSPQWIYSFLGTIRRGAVAVPLSTLVTSNDYANLLNDCGARLLVTNSEIFGRIQSVRGQLNHLQNIVIVDRDGNSPTEVIEFQSILNHGKKADSHLLKTRPEDMAFLIYTSGTTGKPKGVVHTHSYIARMPDEYYKEILHLTSEDVILCTSKLFTAYNLGHTLIGNLKFGTKAILFPGRPTAASVLAILSKYRPTLLFSVPTLYARLVNEIKKKEEEENCRNAFSSLRFCVVGGEYLPPKIFNEWKSVTGLELLDGLGASETIHKVTSNRPHEIRIGSLGRPVNGAQVRIVDSQGNVLKAGEIGYLEVNAKWLFSFYWRDNETRTRERGWWRSTDMCYLDGAGFLFFAGRANDVIKQSGYWVSPHEIESVLADHPSILEVVAFPFLSAESGGLTRIKAVVVLREGFTPSDELARELKKFAQERLAPYKRPELVEFVKTIPRTQAGKVQRKTI